MRSCTSWTCGGHADDAIAFAEQNSARYDPSWPVIPVMRAVLLTSAAALDESALRA